MRPSSCIDCLIMCNPPVINHHLMPTVVGTLHQCKFTYIELSLFEIMVGLRVGLDGLVSLSEMQLEEWMWLMQLERSLKMGHRASLHKQLNLRF